MAAAHCLLHAAPLVNYARDVSFPKRTTLAKAFADACHRYWDDGDQAAARDLVPVVGARANVRAVLEEMCRLTSGDPDVTDADRPFPFRGDLDAWGPRARSLVSEMFCSQVRGPDGFDHPCVVAVEGASVERHLATVPFTHVANVLVLELEPGFVSYDVAMALGDRRFVLFAVILVHDDGTESALCLREGRWTHLASDIATPVHVNDVIQKDAVVLFYKPAGPVVS